MRVVNVEQNTPEWITLRQSKIGASDIGIIMAGTDREIFDLYMQKAYGQKKFVSQAMKRGTEMEKEAKEWFEAKHSIRLERPVAIHNEHDWLMASFDGYNDELKFSLEIKCPTEVPDDPRDLLNWERYWWQVQAQMAVGGHANASLLAYSPSKQVEVTILRDEHAIANLIKKGKAFWDRVVSFNAPAEPILHRQDEEAREVVNAMKILKAQIDNLEQQWKILREGAIFIANDQPFECEGVSVIKSLDSGRIDYKAACEANKIDLTPFRKEPKVIWKVFVKKEDPDLLQA